MSPRGVAALTALLAAVAPFTQPATPEQMAGVAPNKEFGIFHMRTSLGSFRSMNGKGRIEFTFTGTVMVNKVDGQVSVTGDVRKEFDKYDRTIYTGTGRAVVTGSWRAVHWFGRDMKGDWFGSGIIRLQGEFDKNLKTGEYWFEDPTKKQYWIAGNVMDVVVPSRPAGVNPNVSGRKKG